MKISATALLSLSLAALLAGCSPDLVDDVAADAAETSTESLDASYIENKHLDLAYGGPWGTQKLDLYLPNEGEGPFPVIVAIHGGGFMQGDKTGKGIEPMLEGVNRGYAVAAVNYRLSGESLFPAAISDVKAAIRYLKANAEEYNLDPDKIAAWGSSAGGHLAALAGTSGDDNALESKNMANASYSSDVQAVVDWYGQIDFLKIDEQFEGSGIAPKIGDRSAADSPESKFLGGSLADKAEAAEKANPETYITENDPAFLIQHGSADPNVPVQQSIDFAEELTKTLGEDKVEFSLFEDAVHGGEPFQSDDNLDAVFAFLDRFLK
ncbi:alpha/beta hydrolase [Planococcus ruber]|uniref:alpha/beta hydrolase n=1 Tax=Planococcus ruber TaxID=2027871 RepID=UPI001FEFB31A|nr:alpha/beta hydrolase [Planococcus ruber]